MNGFDRKTITDFEKNLEELANKLSEESAFMNIYLFT